MFWFVEAFDTPAALLYTHSIDMLITYKFALRR